MCSIYGYVFSYSAFKGKEMAVDTTVQVDTEYNKATGKLPSIKICRSIRNKMEIDGLHIDDRYFFDGCDEKL